MTPTLVAPAKPAAERLARLGEPDRCDVVVFFFVGAIGGFGVLLAGFVAGQLLR
jgi:hypothetical protein